MKKAILGACVIAIALIGYWYYTQTVVENTNPGDSTNGEQRASVGQRFADLLGSGQSLECTYEYGDGSNVSSGTMYMADGGERIRGDFRLTQSGAGPMEMHMVRVDGYNYMWSSAMPQGIKTQVTAENRAQLFEGADAPVGDMNNTQYTCVAWNADASKFTVPTNVTFMDMGAMQKMMGAPKIGEATQINGNGSVNVDAKAMQCAACDQAGPAREQCRQALGCN